MLAVLLGVGVAISYGTGDFFGGLATSRSRAAVVVMWSQLAGLGGIVIAAAVVGGRPTASDFAIGAAAGLIGLCGLVPFYRALSGGRMAVVAPTSAVTAAVVPVAVGLIGGDRLTLLGFCGVVAALTGVLLVSTGEGAAPGDGVSRSAVADAALAVAGGVGFGIVFALLGHVSRASGLWPVVAQRGSSVVLITAVVVLGRQGAHLQRPARHLVVGAGLFDVTANALFILTVRAGDLAVAGVLGSLYPVTTVLLAAHVLGEHVRRIQVAGILLAIGGAALLSM